MDEVYFTPIYYTMAHFSKFIRPGAVRIGFTNSDDHLMVTAAKNPDGSVAVVIFNQETELKHMRITLGESTINLQINGQAIQTVVIPQP